MDEQDWLTEQFEANRTHLRAVAYRMLGSPSEADDAVQETWVRLSRADTRDVTNLGGWLTTVLARVCVDMLRSRTARREESLDGRGHDLVAGQSTDADPEHEAVLADSVGIALLLVLDTLAPAERLAFVLHDMFAMPFDEIARIEGCSPAAARQLASRARRRVQGATPASDADLSRKRAVVDAFLAASRGGDFDALLALLDPDVVLSADDAAVSVGAAGRSAARWMSPAPSPDGPGWRIRLSSTARSARCGRRAADPGSCSASRLWRERSSLSTCSPTPSGFVNSTC